MKENLRTGLPAAVILIGVTAVGCERERTEGELRSPEPIVEPTHGTGEPMMPPPGAGVRGGAHEEGIVPSEPGQEDPVAPPPVGRHGLEPGLGEEPPLEP